MISISFCRPGSEIEILFSCNYCKKSENQTSVLNRLLSGLRGRKKRQETPENIIVSGQGKDDGALD